MTDPSESLDAQIELGKLITKFITNTDKLGKAAQTLSVLSARLKLLEDYWSKAVAAHTKLRKENQAIVTTHPYFVNDAFEDLEMSYIMAKSELLDRMGPLTPPGQALGETAAGSSTVHVIAPPATLPKLDLPDFSGEQKDWEAFKEMFTSLVVDVTTIGKPEKLRRLLKCVKGRAALRLSKIKTPTNANWDLAWDILLKTYDQPRIKQADQLNRLLSMPTMKKGNAEDITLLIDTVDEAVNSLTELDRPVNQWDDWFVHLIEVRLDKETKTDWEKSIEAKDGFPTYADFKKFLECRARTLVTTSIFDQEYTKPAPKPTSIDKSQSTAKKQTNKQTSSSSYSTQVSVKPEAIKTEEKQPCSFCKQGHFVYYCPRFMNTSVEKRKAAVTQLGLCQRCLRPKHTTGPCPSTRPCGFVGCHEPHNTLLHEDAPLNTESASRSSSKSVKTTHHTTGASGSVTLLATAQVILETPCGETLLVRALLDPCSEVSFVSERVVQSLRLSKKRSCTKIAGVGGEAKTKALGEVELFVKSTNNADFSLRFAALVLPRVTSVLPGEPVERGEWQHIHGLELADPKYYVPGAVDCLLGGQVYSLAVLEGLRKGDVKDPVAQLTVFGWVLTGPTGQTTPTGFPRVNLVRCHHTRTSDCRLRDDLRKFWEQEEIAKVDLLSPKEKECEEHFIRTHSRDETGRYVLRLPFSRTPDFPGSLKIARGHLLATERRRRHTEKQRQAYGAFMTEYEDLGHMERIPEQEVEIDECNYVPHHAIFQCDSSGKIRIVFNASQLAENGLSLNGCLHPGPKRQTDIATIITRWRFLCYVFATDIIKMFRQFKIHPDDRDWLRIVWRHSLDQAVQHYRLTTVTYGTACAPYQAIRSLLQLAEDERERYPLGAAILEKGTYVDDAFAGGDTLEEAAAARDQLIGILRSAGMELDKWSANDPFLLSQLSETNQDLPLSEEDVVSTLGLHWRPLRDVFFFVVHSLSFKVASTKRGLLSVVARLFDPIGWLCPILIRAKILIQMLWLQGNDWDQELEDQLLTDWTAFLEQLKEVETISIPRFFGGRSSSRWFLHGFCDASERAYAAVLYFVTADDDGQWKSSLIVAKSKVAPLKTLSIPRLELCGAVLLAHLISALVPQLLHPPAQTFCWSDSTITLAWLRDLPARWATYVAHRVGEIHSLLPDVTWNHVCSGDNPADAASRGLSPAELRDSPLWWHGPQWLHQDWSSWMPPTADFKSDLERKTDRPLYVHVARHVDKPFSDLISRFSSFRHLCRTFAYVLRWPALRSSAELPGRGLTAAEISRATFSLVRTFQAEHFATELACLRRGVPLPKRSVIRRCLPFLDEHGVLRVGGRLQNFALTYDEKHPALVPLDCHLTTLIIREAHHRTLHGGPQLVLSYIQRRFWIPQVRNKIRRLVRDCVRCVRFLSCTEKQQMAPLPSSRGLPSRPFTTCGLDFAGPFPVRTSKGRGQRSTKGYVCLFVCLTTRAIHLEVVSDLSTQMFLAAFRRFTSRRGLCKVVHSDNGTNFQGASAELRRLFDAASSFSKDVADVLANDGIEWRFIPPRAPHFGGLWEAGVKSFKHHLKRVLGDSTLTFEEFSTLTAQIEACLNSRPLSPLSNNPEDLAALTPGHFLIGAALTALPEPSDYPTSLSGVDRYQLSTVMRNHFWRRWQKEVLHQFQTRSKWLTCNTKLKVGDLVLITDINLPATKWPLARVLALHVGPDGLHRVATLRTSTTTLDRPLVKLVRLPTDPEDTTAGGADAAMAGGPHDASHPLDDTAILPESSEEED